MVLVTVLVLVKVIFGFVLRLLNNHFTFYISYLGMNYSNVIGFLLFLVFILQFISGLLLSCYYSPFSIMAFDSVYYIMIDVNVGWLIRWLHCLGASLFMLFILIHWIRGAWIRLKVIDSYNCCCRSSGLSLIINCWSSLSFNY